MGTYFPPLNLSLDADERAVKRAYAAALKITRPDDDPAAFQALVAARDRALDWVQRRATLAQAPALDVLAALRSVVGPEADQAITTEADVIGTEDHLPSATILASSQEDNGTDTVLRLEPLSSPTTSLPIVLTSSLRISTPEPGFAAQVRSQQTSRQALSAMAIALIRDEAGGGSDLSARWQALLTTADDLDLSGRMALERAIAIELDETMQSQASSDPAMIDLFAATVLRLDQAFRWSQDPRRVVRILGEPSGAHPLVFAIERFGENAVRLRMSPSGFPLIPDSDLVAWFGAGDHASVKAYRNAEKTERFGFSWSWHAFLSPPAWCVRSGLTLWGIGFAIAAIIAVYALFDPIANVGTANAFVSFLAVLTSARVAAALSARTLEASRLVRVINRIEAGPLPSLGERRRLIASAHGSKLLNVIVGLFFLLLVDGYCLALIIPAMNLRSSLVADMIVVPDRKTQGVTFADRLVAQSYLDHAREIAEEIDDLLKAEKSGPPNPLHRSRIEALQQGFMNLIKSLPIGEYAGDFEQFRHEIALIKRRS